MVVWKPRCEPFDQPDVASLDGSLLGEWVKAGGELGACPVAPVGTLAGHEVDAVAGHTITDE
jgi:hypothetical protein